MTLTDRAERFKSTFNDSPIVPGDIRRAWLAGYRAAQRDARRRPRRSRPKYDPGPNPFAGCLSGDLG